MLLKCCLIIGLTVAVIISPFIVNAQISEHGLPESFSLKLKNAALIPVLQLDSVHVQKMLKSDQEFKIDNRYGVVDSCNINIKEAGVRTEIKGKGTIWQYKIESQDAFSLGLYFKNYLLPPNAKVFIYNTSRSQLRGAFTNRNNSDSGHQLPVAEFPGKNLIIEYFEPFSPEFSGELILGGISQAYMDLKVQAGRIGINCPPGKNWQIEKNSVCLITFHDWLYSYFCNGTLLNNVKEDLTPYFLTANHCIRDERSARTMVAYFNYENSGCNTNDASVGQSISGATFLSGSKYTDFSLLLLKEYPPDAYNPFYAGWDATGNDPTRGVCIHHPNQEPKCIARDSLPIPNYPYKAFWTSDGTEASMTLPNTHWMVEFTEGSLEQGSSGSPLFDQNKRVVGQLHGGTNFLLLFGKFSNSWDYYSSYSEQLAHWLDPDSISNKVLDGAWKISPTANFRSQIQQVCPNTPVHFYDETTQNPIGWLWKVTPSSYVFANGTDSTSQNPQIVFLDEGSYSVSLNSSNKYGSDELIHQNYILSSSKMKVKFNPLSHDNVICGCDLKAFPVVAKGAVLYDYKIDQPALVDIKPSADTLYLTLKLASSPLYSFDTWVKVVGSNGTCIATDSLLLHIINQPNDSISHAAKLHLGRNAGYSNRCATVENNEPHPAASMCMTKNNWCPDQNNNYKVLDNSIWFTFLAPSIGGITINTHGFDTQIAVYEELSDLPKLSQIHGRYKLLAANDDRSYSDNTSLIENMLLKPNKEYLLQVDGNNASYGDLVIELLSNSLEVFPNPSKGIFQLIVSRPDDGIADVSVSDLNGRKLYSSIYNVSLDTNQFNIDLSGFEKGIYLLNVRMNGFNLSKKLVLW